MPRGREGGKVRSVLPDVSYESEAAGGVYNRANMPDGIGKTKENIKKVCFTRAVPSQLLAVRSDFCGVRCWHRVTNPHHPVFTSTDTRGPRLVKFLGSKCPPRGETPSSAASQPSLSPARGSETPRISQPKVPILQSSKLANILAGT